MYVVLTTNLSLLSSWRSQEASREKQEDKASTKEQGKHKHTTTRTIRLESATDSVGHYAFLRVERIVEPLLQSRRIQIA